MSATFDDLGDDVVEIIISYIKHYNPLASLKMTCVRTHNHISRYSIAKLMLPGRLGLFSLRTYCANTNCTKTTDDVFYKHYRNHSYGYEHVRQLALNKTTVLINYKRHELNTHYCNECFKNFVLVGELKNVKHNYNWIDEVNISYPR